MRFLQDKAWVQAHLPLVAAFLLTTALVMAAVLAGAWESFRQSGRLPGIDVPLASQEPYLDALTAHGDYDAAARGLRLLARSGSHRHLHYNRLGLMLVQQGRLPEAQQAFEQAIRMQPDFADGHVNLGTVLQDQGHPDQARRQLERALQLDPRHAEAHHNMGVLFGREGELRLAVEMFQRTLQINPGHAGARQNLAVAARLLEERGDSP